VAGSVADFTHDNPCIPTGMIEILRNLQDIEVHDEDINVTKSLANDEDKVQDLKLDQENGLGRRSK
jgi:hypothetical protein